MDAYYVGTYCSLSASVWKEKQVTLNFTALLWIEK